MGPSITLHLGSWCPELAGQAEGWSITAAQRPPFDLLGLSDEPAAVQLTLRHHGAPIARVDAEPLGLGIWLGVLELVRAQFGPAFADHVERHIAEVAIARDLGGLEAHP